MRLGPGQRAATRGPTEERPCRSTWRSVRPRTGSPASGLLSRRSSARPWSTSAFRIAERSSLVIAREVLASQPEPRAEGHHGDDPCRRLPIVSTNLERLPRHPHVALGLLRLDLPLEHQDHEPPGRSPGPVACSRSGAFRSASRLSISIGRAVSRGHRNLGGLEVPGQEFRRTRRRRARSVFDEVHHHVFLDSPSAAGRRPSPSRDTRVRTTAWRREWVTARAARSS